MPSRSKSLILSILNRTASSKRKLFRCKIAKNEICELCNVVCDNYHVVAECMFSFMFVSALEYLDSKNIKLTENTFAFLLRYQTFQVTSIVKSFIFYVKLPDGRTFPSNTISCRDGLVYTSTRKFVQHCCLSLMLGNTLAGLLKKCSISGLSSPRILTK